MARLLIATTGMIVLTFIPAGYEKLVRRDPAEFPKLVAQLEDVRLCPEGWQLREGTFEFSEFWRGFLGLHAYWNAILTTPEGIRLNILVMLSETGEQLFHTPAVCYESHGCEVRGGEVALSLDGVSGGEARAVEVVFNEFADDTPRIAVFSYWVSPGWIAPPRSSMRSQLGVEPYLLKVQFLVEGAKPSDAEAKAVIEDYFSFLGEQFREHGL